MFDTLIVFLRVFLGEFFEKKNYFEKSQQKTTKALKNFPAYKRDKIEDYDNFNLLKVKNNRL